ncbi:MAG: radical SAM protein [Desulfobacterales bacterium]|nr:radical SAM protein [Desulfobacterales bacterium]
MTLKRTVAFSRDAVNVFFHVLTRCNLHCRHCYINPDQHGTATLPVETIETWLDAFADRAPVTNVIFLGGEPTLHPDLARAVAYAKNAGFGSITIDTNGYLFNDILGRITPDQVDFISFSLDGATAAVNDALRGPGSFDRCLAGIGRAVARGFSASLIYTVSRANLDGLRRMPELLARLGIGRFFIQVIGIRGRSAADGSFQGGDRGPQLSRAEWLSTIPAVAQEVADLGITVTYPKVFLEAGETFACAGKVAENYFIFPNGRVYRCPLCEDHPFHSLVFEADRLVPVAGMTEERFFDLDIAEGCVMNKLIQPGNIDYGPDGTPAYRIACCLLKEEIDGARGM